MHKNNCLVFVIYAAVAIIWLTLIIPNPYKSYIPTSEEYLLNEN